MPFIEIKKETAKAKSKKKGKSKVTKATDLASNSSLLTEVPG
jgi:hypothetical protein